MAFTSQPWSTRPASYVSSMWYSNRARRFSAMKADMRALKILPLYEARQEVRPVVVLRPRNVRARGQRGGLSEVPALVRISHRAGAASGRPGNGRARGHDRAPGPVVRGRAPVVHHAQRRGAGRVGQTQAGRRTV